MDYYFIKDLEAPKELNESYVEVPHFNEEIVDITFTIF